MTSRQDVVSIYKSQKIPKKGYEAKPKLIDKVGKSIRDFAYLSRHIMIKSKCIEMSRNKICNMASLEPIIKNSFKEADQLNLLTTNLFIQLDSLQRKCLFCSVQRLLSSYTSILLGKIYK
ncbi:uncharacterized protein LOC135927394 isoform X2 [Gordionus sp. m RMFG-2023]|uniref:uncharacterized protein LOC135927394 isoform X2 n=1 Tax=Gordionus sp. m RMFG-2023 TaxID=3053472 RepID=UPI0031FDF136